MYINYFTSLLQLQRLYSGLLGSKTIMNGEIHLERLRTNANILSCLLGCCAVTETSALTGAPRTEILAKKLVSCS